MTRLPLLIALLIAGPGWAGERAQDAAWIGKYRIHDAKGDRNLVLVRSDSRVEYRVDGQPVRVWCRTPDGIELREVDIADKRIVTFAPGELRTLNMESDWVRLSELMPVSMLPRLEKTGHGTLYGQSLERFGGSDSKGQRIELDWLPDVMLPARYHLGPASAPEAITLLQLARTTARVAYTSLDGFSETDHADIGDEVTAPDARGDLSVMK